MTQQHEILGDPNYIPLLDHGFLGLIDTMGDDLAIAQAARVSYGAGTRSVREDRGLIRYLFRHFHTSPIEQAEVKFHLRLPIIVMRQLVRHRTANLNEYSGRYSIMTDEFYLPDKDVIQPQSSDNKQGRGGDLSPKNRHGVQWMMQSVYDLAYDCYQVLLGERDKQKFIQGEVPFGAYEDDPIFDDDFQGIAREIARSVLPVANYTECYWKIDLANLFKFLKLRTDSHAQYEIRVFADAMFKLIQPIFPLACEAFIDYQRDAVLLSRMEVSMMKDLLSGSGIDLKALIEQSGGTKSFAESYDMTKRELDEFVANFTV